MANNYTKTMRQALQEARSYRDTTEGGPGSGPQKGNPGKKYSDKKIKQAYGILNDPRYKQGNYSGAAKAINKLAPGLADHPDVKNALKRANENLDLSATGDTTTSNASQEVEQVEDLKEFTGMSISKSVNSNDVATALKNLKKGTKLYVQGKPRGGQRTMGDVVSVSGDTVKIKPTASNGPTSVNVKDITMMDTLKEELDEATFSTSQIDALKKAYGSVGPGGEKNAMKMDKLEKLMSRYPKTMLNTLAKSDIPMVSKVAKELMKEETLVEQWKFEMDIETNDDGDMILVHGNVSASSESQAQQKFDKLEKEMEKKYGQGSVEGGVFKGKNTHTSGRGPVTRKNI